MQLRQHPKLQAVPYAAGGAVSTWPFWKTHAFLLLQYINAEPLKKLVSISFEDLEVIVETAPLLLLHFCQPVIKPKTPFTHLL